jgi:hypothetical protein
MSENQNPEEPMIIKTDRPHTVTMPEGTNIAVGKKGEVGAPVVRKVMADGEGEAVENVVMDGGVSSSNDPSKDVMAKGENNKGYQSKEEGLENNKGFQSKEQGLENIKGYQSAAEAPDRFAAQPKEGAVPPPNKKSIDVSQLDNILKTKAVESSVDTVTNEPDNVALKPVSQANSVLSEAMPEMNFPARVIKVKIANDQVRERLDKLE